MSRCAIYRSCCRYYMAEPVAGGQGGGVVLARSGGVRLAARLPLQLTTAGSSGLRVRADCADCGRTCTRLRGAGTIPSPRCGGILRSGYPTTSWFESTVTLASAPLCPGRCDEVGRPPGMYSFLFPVRLCASSWLRRFCWVRRVRARGAP